ncbi:MAG TPA: copper-binding protein [Thermoanaerobaculia bacterium]|nr:copper-binding protein [Thermoanaerobaculia bacterium]
MRRMLAKNLGLACAVLLLAAGCGARGRDFTMRALVVQAPDPANPAAGLYLYHEAIDDWVGRDGKRDGMDPMAMPFPVARGVSLAGIAANDKVEVTLHVDWQADRAIEITKLRKLPADTKLVFRAAKPPKP